MDGWIVGLDGGCRAVTLTNSAGTRPAATVLVESIHFTSHIALVL